CRLSYRLRMDNQQRKAAFAKRFNAALEASGNAVLSDGDLVKLLARHGVATSPQTVSNWRNGKHFPKLEQIEGIAKMLGVDVCYLAFGKEKQRLGEAQGNWNAAGAKDQAVLDALTVLEPKTREVVQQLIRLLGPSERRPGPRKRSSR